MTIKLRGALLAGAALTLLLAPDLNADDLFQLTWRATTFSQGDNGQLTITGFSERDVVQKIATDNNLDTGTTLTNNAATAGLSAPGR